MAKRRRGFSEESLLLLVLLLIGLASLAAAMAFSVVVSVAVVGKPVPAVLGEVMPPQGSPTPTPGGEATPTPGSEATPTPTPTLADTTPPGQVTGLVAGPGGGSGEVQVTWDANQETDVAKYNVYSSATMGGPYDTVIATIENDQVPWLPDGTRGFIEFPVSGALWFVVSAEDLAGNEGAMSVEACGAPVGDSCIVID